MRGSSSALNTSAIVAITAACRHVSARSRNASGTVNPMAFGWDPNLKPYKQDLAQAKKLLAEAGYPNGVDITFHEGPPIVEPAIQQTNDAIVADMAKAGFRVKRNYIGDTFCIERQAYLNLGGLTADTTLDARHDLLLRAVARFGRDSVIHLPLLLSGNSYTTYRGS